MKQLTILLVGVLLAVSSCTEEKPATPELFGTWQWKFSYYDNQPVPAQTPENTGVEKLIVLTEDFKWKKLENNVIVGSGSFSTGRGKSINPLYKWSFDYDSIIFHSQDEIQLTDWEYYELTANTLSFCVCFLRGNPGMMSRYVRRSY